MNNNHITLTLQEEKDAFLEELDKVSIRQVPMFGIYFNGKQVNLSKRRVYKKAGIAKAMLYRYFRTTRYVGNYPNGAYFTPQHSQQILDEMLANGTIEIKQL